jgi:hypothetical protein
METPKYTLEHVGFVFELFVTAYLAGMGYVANPSAPKGLFIRSLGWDGNRDRVTVDHRNNDLERLVATLSLISDVEVREYRNDDYDDDSTPKQYLLVTKRVLQTEYEL